MTEPDAPEMPELPRGVALAWGVAANPQRGPKREMSVERIVEAAVDIADADGIAAVSMSAVAKRLGFTPMSLYRYITAKDDLLLLMQEEATGLPPEAYREAEGWRAGLEVLYLAQVEIYLRHPWMLALPISGSPITPNSSSWLEASLHALEGTALDDDERIAVALLVTGQARWCGMVLAGYTEQARATGLSADEVSARESALFAAVVTEEAYPRLRRAIDAGVFVSEADPFRFGLDRSLDGVEAYLASLDGGGARADARPAVEQDDADVAGDRKYRDAQKATSQAQRALREAEKNLRQARKAQAQTLKDARERARKSTTS